MNVHSIADINAKYYRCTNYVIVFFVLLNNIKYMQSACYYSKTLDGYTETSKFSMFLKLIVREIFILKYQSVLHY